MISAKDKNRLWYYNLLKDFLEHKIKAFPFKHEFMRQRGDDLDENKKSGVSDYYASKQWTDNELKFKREYDDRLYNQYHSPADDVSILLDEYVQGAKKYGIKGDLFFSGIYEGLFIDIRDFYPRNRKEAELAGWDDSWDEFGFPELSEKEYKEEYYIDEAELRRRIQKKFNILEENKERWV